MGKLLRESSEGSICCSISLTWPTTIRSRWSSSQSLSRSSISCATAPMNFLPLAAALLLPGESELHSRNRKRGDSLQTEQAFLPCALGLTAETSTLNRRAGSTHQEQAGSSTSKWNAGRHSHLPDLNHPPPNHEATSAGWRSDVPDLNQPPPGSSSPRQGKIKAEPVIHPVKTEPGLHHVKIEPNPGRVKVEPLLHPVKMEPGLDSTRWQPRPVKAEHASPTGSSAAGPSRPWNVGPSHSVTSSSRSSDSVASSTFSNGHPSSSGSPRCRPYTSARARADRLRTLAAVTAGGSGSSSISRVPSSVRNSSPVGSDDSYTSRRHPHPANSALGHSPRASTSCSSTSGSCDTRRSR